MRLADATAESRADGNGRCSARLPAPTSVRRGTSDARPESRRGADERPLTSYAKNGTLGTAYLRIASSLMSTPMPGFSDTRMNPFSTHGPS